jgi:hypothetical protein
MFASDFDFLGDIVGASDGGAGVFDGRAAGAESVNRFQVTALVWLSRCCTLRVYAACSTSVNLTVTCAV